MKKPPKRARCDLSVGWHSDQRGAPVIDHCKELATRVIQTGRPGVMAELFVCDKHADYQPAEYGTADGGAK